MANNLNLLRSTIEKAQTSLGIELGSTRIKAVLIGANNLPIATGEFEWENKLENGYWTYSLEDVWKGLQSCYASLAENVQAKFGITLKKVGSIGLSGMMHGYLVFDKKGNQLVPFRTWRNTTTARAAEKLTKAFNFNMPQRWSTTHLYQAVLNKESHIGEIDYMISLAGYIHEKLTGKRVIGVGEAAGLFPVDSKTMQYDKAKMEIFNKLIEKENLPWLLEDIMPQILVAGDAAGVLSKQGAALLDVCGNLSAGIPLCPPEGDAGTGMVATNTVALRTGNVSAGTSIFAGIVLEKAVTKLHAEIEMLATPCGKPVALAHANNCTADLDAWVKLFGETLALFDLQAPKSQIYEKLYNLALLGEKDCDGIVSYNYYSGEHVTNLAEGRPLSMRLPESELSLANFMRNLLYSAVATLKICIDVLVESENISLELLQGHGGFFKTEGVGQHILASALNVPVAVMETAGEGGAWGIALLAAYMVQKTPNESLESFLENKVFMNVKSQVVKPCKEDVEGFKIYIQRYKKGLCVEREATQNLH